MTAQWIHDRASRIDGFPQLLEQHIVHLVLSHHGSMEYGSPRVPSTIEALLVHHLDEIDSRINSWTQAMSRDHGENWTDYNKLYDRHLWKGPSPTSSGKRPVEARSHKKRHKVPPAAPVEGAPAEASGPREPREPREARGPREQRDARPPRESRERTERPPRPEKRGPAKETPLTFKPFAAIAAGAEPEPEPEPKQEPSPEPGAPEASKTEAAPVEGAPPEGSAS
jgi:3'-5' exoribonuclease